MLKKKKILIIGYKVRLELNITKKIYWEHTLSIELEILK
jgi:hypothetical protein